MQYEEFKQAVEFGQLTVPNGTRKIDTIIQTIAALSLEAHH